VKGDFGQVEESFKLTRSVEDAQASIDYRRSYVVDSRRKH
jgi:hypothetical protein